jgi:hypothetical protein
MRSVLALVTIVGWLTPAHAGNDVGVVVNGDGAELAQLSAHVSSWLSRHGRALVTAPISLAALDRLGDCFVREQLDCARRIVDAEASVTAIVYVRVREQRTLQDLALTAYWLEKGRAVISEQGGCRRCTSESLSAATDDMMTRLLRDVMRSMGRLKLRSSPSGARITLDGEAIGITPLDWDVAPGTHTIRIEDGKRAQRTRTIIARADATDVVDIALTDEPTGPRDGGGSQRGALPAIAMAAGSAAIITGAVLIAIDKERTPAEPQVNNTAPVGAGIAIAGGVVAAIGAYLWIRAPEARSAPVAAVTGNAAYVGWLGRF